MDQQHEVMENRLRSMIRQCRRNARPSEPDLPGQRAAAAGNRAGPETVRYPLSAAHSDAMQVASPRLPDHQRAHAIEVHPFYRE